MKTRLTLLHECIHTDFSLGEHRQRWDRRQDRCKTYYQELEEKESAQLPDEIVAEQKLKRDYPALFEGRARYYVEMQQQQEKEIATRQPDDPFWPYTQRRDSLKRGGASLRRRSDAYGTNRGIARGAAPSPARMPPQP